MVDRACARRLTTTPVCRVLFLLGLLLGLSFLASGLAGAAEAGFSAALAAGAPSPHSPTSVSRQVSIACLPFSSTAGNCGSISISLLAMMPATAMRANHLGSAGTTYHGAQGVLVCSKTAS